MTTHSREQTNQDKRHGLSAARPAVVGGAASPGKEGTMRYLRTRVRMGRRIAGFALVALLGAVLVACAGEDGAVGPAGPPGPAGPEGPAGPPGEGLEPMTRHYELDMVDYRVVQGEGPGMEVAGNFWNWAPNVIVAYRGDTVHLTVTNSQAEAHGLRFPDFEELRTERLEQDQSDELVFEANEAGVFHFRCSVRYDAENNDCTPDHGRQVGYLIVLDR